MSLFIRTTYFDKDWKGYITRMIHDGVTKLIDRNCFVVFFFFLFDGDALPQLQSVHID